MEWETLSLMFVCYCVKAAFLVILIPCLFVYFFICAIHNDEEQSTSLSLITCFIFIFIIIKSTDKSMSEDYKDN